MTIYRYAWVSRSPTIPFFVQKNNTSRDLEVFVVAVGLHLHGGVRSVVMLKTLENINILWLY